MRDQDGHGSEPLRNNVDIRVCLSLYLYQHLSTSTCDPVSRRLNFVYLHLYLYIRMYVSIRE